MKKTLTYQYEILEYLDSLGDSAEGKKFMVVLERVGNEPVEAVVHVSEKGYYFCNDYHIDFLKSEEAENLHGKKYSWFLFRNPLSYCGVYSITPIEEDSVENSKINIKSTGCPGMGISEPSVHIDVKFYTDDCSCSSQDNYCEDPKNNEGSTDIIKNLYLKKIS